MISDPLLWLTAAVGLYMAWNIGANDVANAMGTSVGSRALTLHQAILLAGILEFAGAVLVGGYVTDTVRRGIVDPAVFAGQPRLMACGMTAALVGAAVWLNVASFLGWPVSTTHSIVGAVAGFGLLVGGAGAVNWRTLAFVAASWVVSPLAGGLVSYLLYMWMRRRIIQTDDPGRAAREHLPQLVAVMAFVLTLAMLFKGLKNIELPLLWYESLGLAAALALLGYGVLRIGERRRLQAGRTGPGERSEMERIFRYLQITSASFVAFAHGANDVANAVGPMAAVLSVLGSGTVSQIVQVPLWILMVGGGGIVLGLATYGYRVMGTIGERITEITPTRGYAAEFGTALTILVGSKLGLPLSTTHTLVGSVIGVGFARGIKALNLRVVRNIVVSWILTIPLAALVCILAYCLLRLVM